jgi:hypothetical protein
MHSNGPELLPPWRTAAETVSVETRASCYHRGLHTHRTAAAMSATLAASHHRKRTRPFPDDGGNSFAA